MGWIGARRGVTSHRGMGEREQVYRGRIDRQKHNVRGSSSFEGFLLPFWHMSLPRYSDIEYIAYFPQIVSPTSYFSHLHFLLASSLRHPYAHLGL